MQEMTLERIDIETALNEVERLGPGWVVSDEGHLRLTKGTANFMEGLGWVNQVAELAEELNHHPDVYLSFKQVGLDLYSHKLEGLCAADFELAKRIDRLG